MYGLKENFTGFGSTDQDQPKEVKADSYRRKNFITKEILLGISKRFTTKGAFRNGDDSFFSPQQLGR